MAGDIATGTSREQDVVLISVDEAATIEQDFRGALPFDTFRRCFFSITYRGSGEVILGRVVSGELGLK